MSYKHTKYLHQNNNVEKHIYEVVQLPWYNKGSNVPERKMQCNTHLLPHEGDTASRLTYYQPAGSF